MAAPIATALSLAGYVVSEIAVVSDIKEDIADNYDWGACCKDTTYNLTQWLCSDHKKTIPERLSYCLNQETKIQNVSFLSQLGVSFTPFLFAAAVGSATYWYISSKNGATRQEERPILRTTPPPKPTFLRKIGDLFSSRIAQAVYGVIGFSSIVYRLVGINMLLSQITNAGINAALGFAQTAGFSIIPLYITNYAAGPLMILAIGVANAYHYTKKHLPPEPLTITPEIASL